ncbi:MAG: diguanylate cyclase [Pseudomonadota bacterium]
MRPDLDNKLLTPPHDVPPSRSLSEDAANNGSAPGFLTRLHASSPWRGLLESPILSNLAMMVLWVLTWQVAKLVEYTEHASVWFPVAGLTFAALLLEGARLVPGMFAGCVIVTIWVGRHYNLPLNDLQLAFGGMLFALAHIGAYAAGARALRAIALRGKRDLPKLVVSFLLIAAVSSLLATAAVLAALVYSGMMPVAEVGATWLPFWIGDLAGVIVLAPFFGAVLATLRPLKLDMFTASVNLEQQTASPRFKYKLLFTLSLLAASMALAYATRSPNSAFAIFFLVIPYMWIASTESAFCNVLAVALGSATIALLVNVLELKEFSMVYQFAINVIAANTLFGLALPTLLADNIALRRIAESDSLTQAASRVHLEQRARVDIHRCRAQGQALTVIVFDIDHFKRINDLFGHALGDQALQHVCRIAQQSLRPADMLGRFGGDEFVALLPGNDHLAAFAIAERIRLLLRDSPLKGGQVLTASFGIAEMSGNDGFKALFERADKALYQAKQDGRNRTAFIPAEGCFSALRSTPS